MTRTSWSSEPGSSISVTLPIGTPGGKGEANSGSLVPDVMTIWFSLTRPSVYCMSSSRGEPEAGTTVPVTLLPEIFAPAPKSASVTRRTSAKFGPTVLTVPTSPWPLMTGWPSSMP